VLAEYEQQHRKMDAEYDAACQGQPQERRLDNDQKPSPEKRRRRTEEYRSERGNAAFKRSRHVIKVSGHPRALSEPFAGGVARSSQISRQYG
jgi:hypothetical protein